MPGIVLRPQVACQPVGGPPAPGGVTTGDDEIIPLQARIETVTDDSDLKEVYNTERHLLYVASTRARDHLLVSGVESASEFLDDLRTPGRP